MADWCELELWLGFSEFNYEYRFDSSGSYFFQIVQSDFARSVSVSWNLAFSVLYFTCSFSWKLLRLFINNKSHLIIGTLFFSFSPILLYRIAIGNNGHLALAAHWLILAALFLYFRDERLDWSWPVLICISVLVQPYLFAMVLVIWFAAVIRLFSKNYLLKFC